MNTQLVYSEHAAHRAKTRSISDWVVDLTVDYGWEYDAGDGCRAYFIGERAATNAKDAFGVNLSACLNTAVILAPDRSVVTVYHCARPEKTWRRM